MIRSAFVALMLSAAMPLPSVGFGQAAEPKKEAPKKETTAQLRIKLAQELGAEQQKILKEFRLSNDAILRIRNDLKKADAAAERKAAKELEKALELPALNGTERNCYDIVRMLEKKGQLQPFDWGDLGLRSDRIGEDFAAIVKALVATTEIKGGLNADLKKEIDKQIEVMRSLHGRQGKLRTAAREAADQQGKELLKEIDDDPKPPKKP